MDTKSPKIPLTFRIYKGDQLLRTETLTQQHIKIGKLSSSHLRIDDELVSRMHAVIETTPSGEVSIIDLGSTKGTFVNGQKINKATLQEGDSILLGETKIVLAIGAPEAAESEPRKATQQFAAVTAPSAAAMGAAAMDDDPTSVMDTSRQAEESPAPRRPVANTLMGAVPLPTAPRSPAPAPRPPLPGPATAVRAAVAAPSVQAAAPQFGADAGADVGGERTIEVAAMLSDSVVAVRHLTDPRGGKVSSTTWAFFGIAAFLALVTTGVFIKGVMVAKDNKERLYQWIEVDKKPLIDFIPIRLNPALDAITILGVLGGLVFVTWGLARMLDEKRSPYFRIGRGKEVEFPTEDAPGGAQSFALVEPQGSDFVFSWAPGMKGEMTVDGQVTPLDRLPQKGPIPHKARIRIESGINTFFVSSVPAPRTPKGAFRLDTALVIFAALSGGLHLGAVGLFYLIPADTRGYSNDDLGDDLRGTRVQMKAQEDPKQEQMEQKASDKESGGTGTKMALDAGKMGKKDSTRDKGQYQIQKVENVDPQLAKAQREEKARKAGVLGVLKMQQGGTFASITGTGDFSAGIDDRDIQGGLIGNEPGEMAGGFGYGLSGMGAGGGGTGYGTIGTGRYGTIGHGSGTGTGYGIGPGGGGMGRRTAGPPKVSIGNATATGDLDKNTIRRYVRQKLSQIEYCYQRELNVKPTLAGTVNTQFTIDGNGRVIAASASGIGDPTVESCVAEVIRSIQFPKPTGGGIVNVTSYPFRFQPAGG